MTDKKILPGFVKDWGASSTRSPLARHPVAAGRLTVQRRLLDDASFERGRRHGLEQAARFAMQQSAWKTYADLAAGIRALAGRPQADALKAPPEAPKK